MASPQPGFRPLRIAIAEASTGGHIILLNGTSSAGKSTLANALRPQLPLPFCYYASDQLADAGFRALDPQSRAEGREQFFAGFHRSIPAFASAGLNLLVEHIVEEQSWADDLARLLAPFDTFWIGVYAPLQELERRETLRRNRSPGEAAYHLKTHTCCRYDLEVDSTNSLESNVNAIVNAWNAHLLSQ